MQVGIHTGTVLCGIVGKRRFKFDVWSNDVSVANKMESSGKPGMVHISEKTYEFLKDQYFVQDGEEVGGKSYVYKLTIGIFLNFKCVVVFVEQNHYKFSHILYFF